MQYESRKEKFGNIQTDKILNEIANEREKQNEPNVTFGIDGSILSNIISFLTDINCEIPVIFYKDRIFINLKSCDNIQYAEVEIKNEDMIDYNPRLGNSIEKYIIVDARNISLKEIYDTVSILSISSFNDLDSMHSILIADADKNKRSIINVKVFDERIEFHLHRNVIVWAPLIKDLCIKEDIMKGIEKMPAIIKKVRSDSNIKKASVTIEQSWFDRIFSIKDAEGYEEYERYERSRYERSGYERSGYERYCKFNINKKEGLTVTSRSKDGFYKLKLEPKCLLIEPICDVYRDNRDIDTYVHIGKEFIVPVTRLIGIAPILIEIRTDKPIIIEKKLGKCINTLLSVAPRIEDIVDEMKEKMKEEDKEMTSNGILERIKYMDSQHLDNLINNLKNYEKKLQEEKDIR